MESLKTILIVVQIISAFAVIGLVLMQHGKGADMGAAFGSGSSGSLFGATGSANFLSRLTAVFATVFFIATIGITWMGSTKSQNAGVLSNTTAPQPEAPAVTQPQVPVAPAPTAPGQNIPK